MSIEDYNHELTEFSHLFYAFYAKLHRYAFTILRDNHAAEDVIQTVFMKLWEKRGRLLKEEKIAGYLYKTTYNLCLNQVRNDKIRNTHARAIAGIKTEAVAEEVPVTDLAERIRQVVEGLPERCRAVFLKSRVEGKKYAEIASEMGISVKTVEGQVGKALKIFREALKDY